MTVLQNGVQDSYTWRKYGQKEILGARYPRSYFKCSRKSCPARKHVQQSDADPSKLEIAYFAGHTCDDDPPPSSTSRIEPDPMINSSGTRRSTAWLAPVATAPSAQRCMGQPSPFPPCFVPDLTMTAASSNVPRTTGVLPPVADVVLASLSSKQHDGPVPDDTSLLTPSMEEEQGELLFIPSPACSQSELLPTEVAKVEPHGPPVWMEQDVELGDECIAISDFTVPELYH